MSKIRLVSNLIFSLLSFMLIIPFTASCTDASTVTQSRLVVLDLPYLDLQEVSKNYPNLKQLLPTSSTGLVRIPITSATDNSKSIIQQTIEQISDKKPIEIVFINKNQQNLLPRSCSAVVIDGNDFINPKGNAPKLRDNLKLAGDLRTGIDKIITSYLYYRDKASFILITFAESRFNDPDGTKNHHPKMEYYYDYLISRISIDTNFTNTLLMICSTRPPDYLTVTNSSLTPLILKGLNFTTGILYAPSTRKSGILTLNDLRSFIIKFQDPKTETMHQVTNVPGEWRSIAYNQHALIKNYVIRWPILTIYGSLLIWVVFLLTGGVIFRLHRRFIIILAWIFLFLLIIPVTFLLEALFDPLNWMSVSIFTMFISGVVFLFTYYFFIKNLLKALLFISFLTTGIMIIDGLLNGYYEHRSFLGYSLVAGARYYGIGNEYMGILLGSYIAGVTLSLHHLKKWRQGILWSVTIFISLILIHPYFGADVGGGITAMMGLGMMNFLWLKKSIGFKAITLLCLTTLLIFTLMGSLDLYVYKSSMSHLGKLLLSVQKNGIGVFIGLVIRKISLNLRLISSTPLTLLLIGTLLTIPFLYKFPPYPIKELIKKYHLIISGLVGISITALIGLLTNDSGIVSAAMTFLFGIGLIIVLILKELNLIA